jgi:hypothetical protein
LATLISNTTLFFSQGRWSPPPLGEEIARTWYSPFAASIGGGKFHHEVSNGKLFEKKMGIDGE